MHEKTGLEGRVALVTGAGRGIGQATALAFAHAGARVAVNDIDAAAAEDTASQIIAAGGIAIPIAAAIDEPDSCAKLLAAVQAGLGDVDDLVNNAGIPSSGAPIHRTDIAEIERLLRVHVHGPFLLCAAVIPSMRARRSGTVTMVSSKSTSDPPPFSGPYTMAKAAGEALALTLAAENRKYGIRVNVVAPALVDTRMGRDVLARLDRAHDGQPASVERLVSDGMVTPGDIAAAIIGLVTGTGRAVTGQRLVVDLATSPAPIERKQGSA